MNQAMASTWFHAFLWKMTTHRDESGYGLIHFVKESCSGFFSSHKEGPAAGSAGWTVSWRCVTNNFPVIFHSIISWVASQKTQWAFQSLTLIISIMYQWGTQTRSKIPESRKQYDQDFGHCSCVCCSSTKIRSSRWQGERVSLQTLKHRTVIHIKVLVSGLVLRNRHACFSHNNSSDEQKIRKKDEPSSTLTENNSKKTSRSRRPEQQQEETEQQ